MNRRGLYALYLMAVALPVSAQQVSVYIDGKRDDGRFPPQLRNGRTLMFLRDTFDRLGAVVKWEPAEQRIRAWQGDNEIELQIGSTTATVNGSLVTLDQPPILEDFPGRGTATLVPLRFISESLGAGVKYDPRKNEVHIDKSKMSIFTEKAPFSTGDTVEYLLFPKGEWISATVKKVHEFDDKLDSYGIEYQEPGPRGRLMKPTISRTYIRKPR